MELMLFLIGTLAGMALGIIVHRRYSRQHKVNEFLRYARMHQEHGVNLKPLLNKLSHYTADILGAKSVQFFVKMELSGKDLLVGKAKNTKIPQKDIDILDKIVGKSARKSVLFIWPKDKNKSDHKLSRMFKSHNWNLVVPLKMRDRIIGYIFIGQPRKSHYKMGSIGTLRRTYDSFMLAISSATAIYNANEINNTLEQRIKNATKDLQRANDHLRKVDESKDEFLSMASHQLRTPLTSIKGYISMVIDGDAGETTEMQKKFLSEAFSSSERMVHIVSDFLNVSRLQTGKFVLDKTTGNLGIIVAKESEILSASAESRGLKLELEIADNIPDSYADFDKLRQVIMNMVDNAIYYSKPNTKITVSVAKIGNKLEFGVDDNGIGVPKAEQAGLFGKFYRAVNARQQRPDGTGVGLYLAKKVVLSHKGNVIYKSKASGGSVFGFWIPIVGSPDK